jgi:hypothetical protein
MNNISFAKTWFGKLMHGCVSLVGAFLLCSMAGVVVRAADPVVAPAEQAVPAAIPAALLAGAPYQTITFSPEMTVAQISEVVARVLSQGRWEVSQVNDRFVIAAWTEEEWVSTAYVQIEDGSVKVYRQETCAGKPKDKDGWIKKACAVLQAKAKGPAPTGGIWLLFDRGLAGQTPEKQQQLNQLSEYLERSTVAHFKDAGYEVMKIKSRDQFHPGPGKFLLMVATVQYNPGNKAARVLVGFGAGGLITLKLEFQLLGEAPEPILAKTHERGSIRDWQFVCQALSKDLVKFTTDALPATAHK